MDKVKIGYIGTDGRSLLAALETSRATSDLHPGEYQGMLVRGTPAMPPFVKKMGWSVGFIPTVDNSVLAFAETLIGAFKRGDLDIIVIMPEALLFEGLVDVLEKAGYGDRVIGLNKAGSFVEGDKIACKRLCREAGVPVAPAWTEVEARDFKAVAGACQDYLHEHGGAVLKFPYSAGGKGSHIILGGWDIKDTYDLLMKDFKKSYIEFCGKKAPWPLLIEARMSGVEISFTALVDRSAHYQILPTAMDYPERFPGPPGIGNPITGGMGAISPHPCESPKY